MDVKRCSMLWWAVGSMLVVVCVGLIWAAYWFSWSATGFANKTLWDWLQLLIIPLVLAFGAVVFNQVSTHTEREIARDKQREDLLQNYLDRMSELLLEKELHASKPDEEVRNIARVRTINTLIQLDATRVGYIFAFLSEAGLMEHTDPIISLHDANLRNVKWGGADLYGANLSGANLYKSDLSGANLGDAKLSQAKLSFANLSRARLEGADLKEARLNGARLKEADLNFAQLNEADLEGADLNGADLVLADLNNADLTKANFKKANIEKERLSAEQQAQAVWT